MDIEQTEAYLRRIGAARPTSPSARALRELHVAHLRSVPFENLSIHLGEEIELSDEAVVAKVVEARRGGFCYELNGAFAALLASLGFDVTLLQGRVYGEGGRLGIPFDHLALRVRTDEGGDWLADVGFGAHSELPLRFGERGPQTDPAGTFHLVRTAAGDLEVLHDGTPQYLLEERPRELADFRAGAWYHRTSPESHFTRSLVCSILTEDGRITLSGRRLTTTVAGERHVSELASEAEVLAAYERHFGVVLKGEPVLGRIA
ncbi:arylamine N-acetyltransferase [Streptomyces sp. NPDC050703]|uniref:arylamine N-acetyltransferase family protein n=1 Tax=Streptomyces sp. NPDC050703 TaxID=3157218 RepID=UPI0034151CC8